jgi:hypothetical protein
MPMLLDLASELLDAVCDCLELRELVALASTCRRLYRLHTDEDEAFWRRQLLRNDLALPGVDLWPEAAPMTARKLAFGCVTHMYRCWYCSEAAELPAEDAYRDVRSLTRSS